MISASHPASPESRRAGQTILYSLIALVILAFVAMWVFDVHKTLFVKSKSRNAGDSAALAAARWQGISLNLVGDLNVLQAVALSQALAMGADTADARAIADLQGRVTLGAPLIGLLAAQQAAKNNGIFNNVDYAGYLAAHSRDIRETYDVRFPNPPYQNGPGQQSAWIDYADMLDAVISLGIAVMPDNMHLYADYSGTHYLLNPNFYDAVASADWCWFYFYALGLLQTYHSWHDWPPLPFIVQPDPINAEIFGLGLRRADQLAMLRSPNPAGGVTTEEDLRRMLQMEAGVPLSTGILTAAATWYAYGQPWTSWQELIPEDFPFRSSVRPEYDYAGADAAVLLESSADRITPGMQADKITWSAAAKPFGSLEGPVRPDSYALVFPAFSDVRLIPIDVSSAPARGSRPGWWDHIYHHLPAYMARGPDALEPGCWYCAQLSGWEDDQFRQSGLDWLSTNSATCRIVGGGPGPGGGGRRGH